MRGQASHSGIATVCLIKRMAYAELHCLSNFSFQRGASHPQELLNTAIELGYRALAITDECSVAGVVRAHLALRQHPNAASFTLIIGSEFVLDDGLRLLLLATDRASYGELSALISQGRRQAEKGAYCLSRTDLSAADLSGLLCLWLPVRPLNHEPLAWLKATFPERLWLAVELLGACGDAEYLQQLQQLGAAQQVPLVAAGDVHMHHPSRQRLQDIQVAIAHSKPVAECGRLLFANAERHLRPLARLQKIYPAPLLAETLRIAERCQFSLDELRYEYPREIVPDGYSPSAWLRHLTAQGAAAHWPRGVPQEVQQNIEKELQLIAELRYEPFFLTVYDAVKFARGRGILCQGRGSSANSAVCFCLGITAVNPAEQTLLFERFLSKERNEPPDIDVDFEHERREEVIQYLYTKYGRHRAALAATVISYRRRSAVRDVGRALGLSGDQLDRLAKSMSWWDSLEALPERLAELGFDANNPILQQLISLVNELVGFPRHLSQHVGGFVIAEHDLTRLVPVENASMAERTVIQWDKDDLEALGLLKVDVLALGMLTAIRKCFAMVAEAGGPSLNLATVPRDDVATWQMIQAADTVGVFQIESRAQMSMLPRLRPACFYDLVIQVAIVRPGPIQGDMVHPYLERRRDPSAVVYENEALKPALARTLGVPIFQEQVMQLAQIAAGFTPGEADQLRRAMAAWKRKGGLEPFQQKLLTGMRQRGYSAEFSERIFRQIKGFGDYGFPESHAASFAWLAWVSSYLKCHYPAAFTAALINSQPMGFYRPAQLIQDAQRHGVSVLPVDVQHSDWDCGLEKITPTKPAAIRLGLRLVAGLNKQAAIRLLASRMAGGYQSVQDLASRAHLQRGDLEALAAADALKSLLVGNRNRYQAFWQVAGVEQTLPLAPAQTAGPEPLLRAPALAEEVCADYQSLGLSIKTHPLALLRAELQPLRVCTAAELKHRRSGAVAHVAGLVIGRQRPGTATGVIFVSLEDETGLINVVVWASVAEQQRQALLNSQLLMVSGIVQHEDNVLHLVAGKLTNLNERLGQLRQPSRDFR